MFDDRPNNSQNVKAIGQYVRLFRYSQNYSRSQLAEQLNTPLETLIALENGAGDPALAILLFEKVKTLRSQTS